MTSLLQQMTQGLTAESVMQRKAEKATKLTAVKGEGSTTVAQMAAGLPDVEGHFLTKEELRDIARNLRTQATTLLEVADGLDLITGLPTVESVKPVDNTKAKERAADEAAAKRAEFVGTGQEAFDAMLAAKAAAAQAAAFTSADDGATEEPEAPVTASDAGEWVCPKHGDANIRVVTARSRTYRACESCDEFEPK